VKVTIATRVTLSLDIQTSQVRQLQIFRFSEVRRLIDKPNR